MRNSSQEREDAAYGGNDLCENRTYRSRSRSVLALGTEYPGTRYWPAKPAYRCFFVSATTPGASRPSMERISAGFPCGMCWVGTPITTTGVAVDAET